MSRKHHHLSRDNPRTSRLALTSIGLLLANAFQWVVLQGTEILLVALLSTLLGLAGWIIGAKARRRIRKYHGILQGEAAAQIGSWGNQFVFFASLLFFLWCFFIAVYGGQLL
jgi:hypothetical protein